MKVKVIEIKHYQLKKDIINNLKKSDTCKIQLAIAISFISSTDNDEERVMHSKYQKIMINEKTDEVIKKFLKSQLNRYQNNFEKSMKGSEFVFNYVHLLYLNVMK